MDTIYDACYSTRGYGAQMQRKKGKKKLVTLSEIFFYLHFSLVEIFCEFAYKGYIVGFICMLVVYRFVHLWVITLEVIVLFLESFNVMSAFISQQLLVDNDTRVFVLQLQKNPNFLIIFNN